MLDFPIFLDGDKELWYELPLILSYGVLNYDINEGS